ncbi:bifunctional DNA primase/polymerase [Streptomyces xylophagus]|uniref:bifunctional DNA primase/polymerase n=1 Tax=Streptomyces xylophagus TaxID=285514 RepID=UPI0006898C3B|nr:bifunctional DNA primase/polymerase [Streptomyces xylophagus]
MADVVFGDVITPIGFDLAFICSQGMGWRVVPAALGKKFPTLKRWPELATTDLDQVAAWWLWLDASEASESFSSNVCVVTGRESGIWVLDVDPRHGGDESLAALEAVRGPLPETLVVDTPSGGQHYYWAYPAEGEISNAANLHAADGKAHGLDVRGRGGQVMSPFSRLSAGIYMPRNAVEPVTAPTWLEALALNSSRALAGAQGYSEANLPSVDRMIDDAGDVASGGQEDHLFRFLCKLRQLNRSPEEMADLGWELASRFTNEAGHRLGDWSREHVEAKVASVVERYEAGHSETASEAETAWARGAGQMREAVRMTTEMRSDKTAEKLVGTMSAAPVRDDERAPRLVYDMLLPYLCNHQGMASLFLDRWASDVRWDQGEQRFMVFNDTGGSWRHDGQSHEAVHRLVNELALLVHEACDERVQGDDQIQRLLTAEGNDRQARAQQAEGRRRAAAIRVWEKVLSGTGNIRSVINAVVPEAESCQTDDFDRNAHLLNVENGTYDVTQDVLREHRQADLLTHVLPWKLDLTLAEKPLEEVAPLFHHLLWRMCGAPGELDEVTHAARYDAVCRYLGYMLHGANPAKKMGVFIGASDIGKNQALEIEGTVMKPLAFMSAKPSLLTKTRNDRHDGDESPMRGKRMVILNELSGKQVLDDNQVLRLVNPEGTSVSLRRMKMDPVETRITWTITVTTNEIPRGELTPQVQNRLAIFPLSEVRVPTEEQWDIKNAILRGGAHDGVWHEPEVEAVFAHLVKWWREWYVASQEDGATNGGLFVTDEMAGLLSQYVKKGAPLSEVFAGEQLDQVEGGFLKSSEVMDRFNAWVKRDHPNAKREYAGTRADVFREIEALPGVTRKEKKRGKQGSLLLGWHGVQWGDATADQGEPSTRHLHAVADHSIDVG